MLSIRKWCWRTVSVKTRHHWTPKIPKIFLLLVSLNSVASKSSVCRWDFTLTASFIVLTGLTGLTGVFVSGEFHVHPRGNEAKLCVSQRGKGCIHDVFRCVRRRRRPAPPLLQRPGPLGAQMLVTPPSVVCYLWRNTGETTASSPQMHWKQRTESMKAYEHDLCQPQRFERSSFLACSQSGELDETWCSWLLSHWRAWGCSG